MEKNLESNFTYQCYHFFIADYDLMVPNIKSPVVITAIYFQKKFK